MISKLLEFTLIDLLFRSKSEKKFYFESKDKKNTLLAIGPVIEVNFVDAPLFLQNNPDRILWSAMNFENLTEGKFYSSAITFFKKNNETSAYIAPELSSSLIDFFPQLTDQLYPISKLKNTTDSPDFTTWKTMIETAISLFNKNKLIKIVLKRKKILEFNDSVCALTVFKKGREKNQDAYKIFYQKNNSEVFISFTPERLFSLTNQNEIETLALAGSSPRGKTIEEDLSFENELLKNPKLTHEQNIVTEEIHNRLNEIATEIDISPLSIMKLEYIQHRANTIKAKLNPEKNFLDLITILHPTPAVGGTPNKLALETISLLEKELRGHYAGPIGFAKNDFSEWAVGLRSATIKNDTITLYSGCGIVNGSDPNAEWEETNNKMTPFLSILEVGLHQ